jgi:hypothetical protein
VNEVTGIYKEAAVAYFIRKFSERTEAFYENPQSTYLTSVLRIDPGTYLRQMRCAVYSLGTLDVGIKLGAYLTTALDRNKWSASRSGWPYPLDGCRYLLDRGSGRPQNHQGAGGEKKNIETSLQRIEPLSSLCRHVTG